MVLRIHEKKSRRLPTVVTNEMHSTYKSAGRELHNQFADIHINTVMCDNCYWIKKINDFHKKYFKGKTL